MACRAEGLAGAGVDEAEIRQRGDEGPVLRLGTDGGDAGEGLTGGEIGRHAIIGVARRVIGHLIGVAGGVVEAVIATPLQLGAELRARAEGVRDGDVDRLLVARGAVTPRGAVGVALIQGAHAGGGHFAEPAVHVQRRAQAAPTVVARGAGVSVAVEARHLRHRRRDTADLAVTEENRIGPAGELEALGIVGIADAVIEKVVARGIISRGADAAEVKLELAER